MAAWASSALSRAMRSVMLSSIWPLKLASFLLMPVSLSSDEAHRVWQLAAHGGRRRAMCAAGARRVALSRDILLSWDMAAGADGKEKTSWPVEEGQGAATGKFRASSAISRSWRRSAGRGFVYTGFARCLVLGAW